MHTSDQSTQQQALCSGSLKSGHSDRTAIIVLHTGIIIWKKIPVIAIEREAEHICGVTTNNYMGALQATTLLVQQMEERKKRKPVPLSEPIHKQITPVLIRWDTTS